jgi:hypothetical protein
LPIDATDLLNLALLSPQVVAIGASDSSAAGFSVGGLRPEANAVTLDGLSFGSTQIPSEATRSTRVITSTYDVTRGQFSGGQIASTTRSGTNTLQGNFSYSLRADELVISGDEESPLSQGYTQNQFSGGVGRAIVKDRFFGFVSAQLRRREDIVPSLFNADAGHARSIRRESGFRRAVLRCLCRERHAAGRLLRREPASRTTSRDSRGSTG